MTNLGALGILAMSLAVLPCMAQPQVAYTSKDVHIRAGPSRDYPVVAILPAGFELTVAGCLSNYSWCDVMAGPNRGWVYAANLNYVYQGGNVPLLNYGAQIGIAVIGFTLLDYWTDHFRDRPFFRDRDQWVNRPRTPSGNGPGRARPEPPRHAVPGARNPQLPQAGSPGQQGPQPPRPGIPSAQRPQTPQAGGPGGQHPTPQTHSNPGGQHPQPVQGSGGERRGAPRPREPENRGH